MTPELKPGRELDALVAEKVMGLKVVGGSPDTPPKMRRVYVTPYGEDYWWIEYEPGQPSWIPFYSTDIATAWTLVEKFRIKYVPAHEDDVGSDRVISALIKMYDGKWMARYDSPCQREEGYYERSVYPDGDFAIGDTVSHAICLAALKAVGG